jgi:hypothetical protein
MIDYHLAKRDYLEESKKKLKKQIELSESFRHFCKVFCVVYMLFMLFCIYVVAICVGTKIS